MSRQSTPKMSPNERMTGLQKSSDNIVMGTKGTGELAKIGQHIASSFV